MIHRFRRIGVVVLSIGCMCLIAACGSSSNLSSGSGGTTPTGHFAGFRLTDTQRACLKKQGVTIPTGAGHFRGGPPNGKFPKRKFHKGKLPKGSFPKGGRPSGAGFSSGSKFRAAFKACGVTFGGPPQGAGSSTTG